MRLLGSANLWLGQVLRNVFEISFNCCEHHALKSDLTSIISPVLLFQELPIKFLNCWWYSGCFQFRGQLTITVLCFRPPSPPIWIRWDVPSLRFEEMTTWEKPFTFSVSINFRKDYKYTERESGCWSCVIWLVFVLQRKTRRLFIRV